MNETPPKNEGTLWRRLRRGLSKTRHRLAEGIGDLLLGERAIDEAVLEELETALLLTDVGVDATQQIIEALTNRVKRRELGDTIALHRALSEMLKERLAPLQQPFEVGSAQPCVMLFVGVNGVGKTTTIGKMAARLRAEGAICAVGGGRHLSRGGCGTIAGLGRAQRHGGYRPKPGGGQRFGGLRCRFRPPAPGALTCCSPIRRGGCRPRSTSWRN